MPPRPFHRWKSFWLGVLVLAFLGWAWVGSVGSCDELLIQWDNYKNLAVRQFNGKLVVDRHNAWNQTLDSVRTKITNDVFPVTEWWQSAIASGESPLPGAPGHYFAVSHWLLILVFLIPWTAFLLWRVRRLKRLSAAGIMDRDGPAG